MPTKRENTPAHVTNIANILTLFRLALAPVFAWLLYTSRWTPALVTFLIATVTDVTDGYLARRLKEETKLGKTLDPLADKLFFGGGMIVLIMKYDLPPYYFLAIARDVLVGIGGIIFLVMGKAVEFTTTAWGKATTVVQAIAMAMIILLLLGIVSERVTGFFVLLTFLIGIIASAHYLTLCFRKGYI
jgi:CDP-diacylglycerol--glycerol-3-phosphate 3-phosphatidyltransferase